MLQRYLSLGLGLFLIVVGGKVSAQQSLKELRVSAIPDENPQELLRIYTPFVDYLSKEIGLPVKFVPVVDYAATVVALAANRLDLVWYGGFTSVQAVSRAKGAKRIAMRKEDVEFKSKFITRKGSGIRSLKDLKGKTFSFGSVSSTSGHLMPRYFLLQAGIKPERDFAKFSFSGAHDATAAWVEAGKIDAGALNFLVWDKLVKIKKVDTGKVTVFLDNAPLCGLCVDGSGWNRGEYGSKDRQGAAQARLQKSSTQEDLRFAPDKRVYHGQGLGLEGDRRGRCGSGTIENKLRVWRYRCTSIV